MVIQVSTSSSVDMSSKNLELDYLLDVYLDIQQNVGTLPLSVRLHLGTFPQKKSLRLFLVLFAQVLIWISNMGTQEPSLLTASPNLLAVRVCRKLFHICCLGKSCFLD